MSSHPQLLTTRTAALLLGRSTDWVRRHHLILGGSRRPGRSGHEWVFDSVTLFDQVRRLTGQSPVARLREQWRKQRLTESP